ncbi:hypothetical protein ACVILK_003191 [Bradyrhizobium embrapense]
MASVFVVEFDEGADVGLELPGGGMNASLDLLPGEFGKPALNLVDPGRGSRREVDTVVRPASEPRIDLGYLVGGVVVHDDLDIEPFRDLNIDLFEKLPELDRSVASRPVTTIRQESAGHLPTVCSWMPSSAATDLLGKPSAHRRIARQRSDSDRATG